MKLTQSYVQRVEAGERRIKIRDTVLPGLVLFVDPSGKKKWYIDYKRLNGKRTDHKLGAMELFTVREARIAAKNFLALIWQGKDPTKKDEGNVTYRDFLDRLYIPWFLTTHKAGGRSVEILQHEFTFLNETPIKKISPLRIEQWRTQKKQKEVKSATINRLFTALNAALNWAVKNEIMSLNPIAKIGKLSERDSMTRVRYLAPEERKRLMSALDQREMSIREKRKKHDSPFADYLKPLVILSLNTGVRRGTLLALEWRDIDFNNRLLSLRAALEKSGKANKIPLNTIAIQTLQAWRSQVEGNGLIFPSPKNGKVMLSCHDAWKNVLEIADLKDFRWHDMRHDFASQLVMKGVTLNTVRELLGHIDMAMTLRYAHLAPQVMRAAVEMLD